jgi:hypothetical protein
MVDVQWAVGIQRQPTHLGLENDRKEGFLEEVIEEASDSSPWKGSGNGDELGGGVCENYWHLDPTSTDLASAGPVWHLSLIEE